MNSENTQSLELGENEWGALWVFCKKCEKEYNYFGVILHEKTCPHCGSLNHPLAF